MTRVVRRRRSRPWGNDADGVSAACGRRTAGSSPGTSSGLVQLRLVELAALDVAEVDHGLADRGAARHGLLGDLRGRLVADLPVQRGDDGGDDSARRASARASAVSPATHRSASSAARSPADATDSSRLRRHHRHHHVELEAPGRAGPRDRRVVADDLRAHLQHRLGHHRVDLAGHDRRPRLQVGQVDLGEPGGRPDCPSSAGRCRPWSRPTAKVRSSPESSTSASRAPCASKWSRASVNGRPVRLASSAMTAAAKPARRVDAGADGGAAERQLARRAAATPEPLEPPSSTCAA